MIKNMKIFPKTVFYTTSILMIVVVLAHLIFYFIFPVIYEKQQIPKLEKRADVLMESLKDKNITEIRALLNGYSKNDNISAHLKRDVDNGIYEINHDLYIDDETDDQYLFIEERTMKTSDNHDIIVQIVSGRNLVSEYLDVLSASLPIVAAIMMMFSLFFSYFYSRRLTAPLKHIEEVTKKMENMNPNARIHFDSKDEIAEVGNRINEVYEKLFLVIDDLERKNRYIQRMQNQKLDFLRSVSHELKTPLTGLRIMQENMLYNIGKYKNREEYLRKSIKSIDDMSLLLNDILESSKFKEWTEEQVELNLYSKVEDILERNYEIYIDKKLTVNNNVDKDLIIMMSVQALDKVLSNIIGNSIKYSYDKGTVTIYNDEEYLIIENISQRLSDDEISNIFESVFRGEGKIKVDEKSTGLGLYLSRNILESYNLAYAFESYEKGMRFKIGLKSNKDELKEMT